MTRPAWSREDAEAVEYRQRELMSEGVGRVRALAQAIEELIAERRRSAEDDLIRAKGGDPDEIDRRIRDR